MCTLQAGNHRAHWGVKKDLCNGCSACLRGTKCRAAAIVNQAYEDEGRRDLFICVRLRVASSGRRLGVAFKPPDVLANIGFLLLEEQKQLDAHKHRLCASERERGWWGWGGVGDKRRDDNPSVS